MRKMPTSEFGRNNSMQFHCRLSRCKYRYLPAFAALTLGACMSLQDLSGTSSGVEAKIAQGSIVTEDGSAAANARVRLIPAGYDPVSDGTLPDSSFGTTDAGGRYKLYASDTGVYNIQAVFGVSSSRLLIRGVHLAGGRMNVPAATLRSPGAIKVVFPDDADTVNGYLYLPGTDIAVSLLGKFGSAMLDSVPAGVLPPVYYAERNSTGKSRALSGEVIIRPGATETIAYGEWSYSRRIRLNTAFSGAGVLSDQFDFPALVRLTENNFPFNQANSGGADIRFTKSDNTPLHFEIGRWDATAQRAEIWVKIDTMHGNDSTQYIDMYWGNPNTAAQSSGAAVFDSAAGFEGVWHLGETSGARAADASHNGFAGSYKGGLPYNAIGPFGISQSIVRSDSDYIEMGNVLDPGTKNISIGVWVKRAAFGSPQTLIAKTNGDTPSSTFGYLLSFDPYNFLRFHIASGGVAWGDDGSFNVSSNLAITDTATWHFVAVVINRSDNSRCKLYVDGIDRTGSTQGNIANVWAVINALRLCIGTESDNDCSYKGVIAEATIAFIARSADWVKLSYMNQKEQDALVRW